MNPKYTSQHRLLRPSMQIIGIALFASLLLNAKFAHAKTRVVCSTNDLAYFVRAIGSDRVKVDVIAHPKKDIHFVDVRPSFMIKVAKADIVFRVGLDLDRWMDQIINGSRNSAVLVLNCSREIKPLEIPKYKADARYGDIHQLGNPHYWLSPTNIQPITDVIVSGLAKIDPGHSEEYTNRRDSVVNAINVGLKNLQPQLDSLNGAEIIYYHNSWPYFDEFTGLVTAGFIEPFPGVMPSPAQLKRISDLVRSKGIRVIGVEVYFDKRPAEKIASGSNAKVVTLYPSIGGRDKDETYLQWVTGNIDAILEALR